MVHIGFHRTVPHTGQWDRTDTYSTDQIQGKMRLRFDRACASFKTCLHVSLNACKTRSKRVRTAVKTRANRGQNACGPRSKRGLNAVKRVPNERFCRYCTRCTHVFFLAFLVCTRLLTRLKRGQTSVCRYCTRCTHVFFLAFLVCTRLLLYSF